MSRFLAAFLLVLASCGAPAPARPRVAVLVPLSGELAADGRGIERAVRLAAEEQPGAAEIVAIDDGGSPQTAVLAARQAAADPRVVAVIGHLTSGCSIAAAKVYGPAGLAMVTPTATATELTLEQARPDWRGPQVIFRLPPSDAVQGALSAQYAFNRFGLRRFVVIDDGTAYGQGLAGEFAAHFQGRGGTVSERLSVRRGQEDFSAALADLSASRADAVFFAGVYPDAARLLKALRGAGSRAAFLAGDAAKSDDLFRLAGAAVDGAYFTVSGVPIEDLPAASDFVARYRKEYGDQPRTYDVYGYTAARIVLAACRRSGADRGKMLEALRQTDYDGMMGRVLFDEKGDGLKSLVTMTRADYAGRKFDPVY